MVKNAMKLFAEKIFMKPREKLNMNKILPTLLFSGKMYPKCCLTGIQTSETQTIVQQLHSIPTHPSLQL